MHNLIRIRSHFLSIHILLLYEKKKHNCVSVGELHHDKVGLFGKGNDEGL